jgi:predicted RNase H-like HicB family nuclease
VLPGCVSQGKTKVEARRNIEDAITGYFASLIKHLEGIPKKRRKVTSRR